MQVRFCEVPLDGSFKWQQHVWKKINNHKAKCYENRFLQEKEFDANIIVSYILTSASAFIKKK